MMRTSTKLAPITLTDSDGAEVTLASLWAKGPVVLAFIRHFG